MKELEERVMSRRSLGDPLRGSDIGIVYLVNELKWINDAVTWTRKYLGSKSQGTQRFIHVSGQGRQV